MERFTVSNAEEVLQELLVALTNGYWDANDMRQKDVIFDIISSIHVELHEIAKLSVNDFSMAYEPISFDFQANVTKFRLLQQRIDEWYPRKQTADQLHHALSSGVNLVSTKQA